MTRKKRCSCPPHLQQVCRHAKRTDCTDVEEIIQALKYEEQRKVKPKKVVVPLNFKCKKFKPRHYKDTCVPMKPSMHTSGILKGKKGKPIYRKRVRYFDLLPGDIMLSTPTPVVKHTASDKSIFNISGEVIQAQRAAAKPGESKPPLPAKSGFELFKPHSGIVINRDKEFAPDVVHMPGRLTKEKKPKTKPCHKGGPSKDLPYTTLGVTDGKPRARGTQKHLKDDDSLCGLDEIQKPEHVSAQQWFSKVFFRDEKFNTFTVPIRNNSIKILVQVVSTLGTV
ncbi:hypothetical protein MSG28_008087 [Choristoneura fumiferana]|uniref:Uncharacterized protein n=1 Tax=Choristoneura fumiferana TaxID=7141 RepID=A0ACC0JA86_CHOFU|nr:hypothetical protein MSG28_008087 [Choristoneura fumiferana]